MSDTTEWKQVSKAECLAYVNALDPGRQFKYDVYTISEPPVGTWNDFTEGKVWPDSIVAKVKLYDGSVYHDGKQHEYYIPRPERKRDDTNGAR